MPKQIYVMHGCPGSGKSTYAKNVIKATDDQIVSADKFFMKTGKYQFDPSKLGQAHGFCMSEFKKKLGTEPIIVVDNTNMVWRDIREYVEAGFANGYMVTIVHMNTDARVAAARNVHGVPVDKVLMMADRKLEFPASCLNNPLFSQINVI